MITLIDNIRYLKEDKKAILDQNKIINNVFKERMNIIKRKLKSIPTNGQTITVAVAGSPDKTIDFKSSSVDEQIVKKIERIINDQFSK